MDVDVATYTYDGENQFVVYGKNESGDWVDMSQEHEFIGNINPFRLNGNYYDHMTGYYMINSCCYDSRNNEYIVDNDYSKAYIDANSTISTNGSISTYSTYDQIMNLYTSSMNSTTFGKSISHSPTWYSSLSSVELAARLIYGEVMVTSDIPAVTWELCNRVTANWSGFYGSQKTNTLWNIMTKPSAYAAITAGINETAASRQPDLTSQRWSDAVYNACALVLNNRSTLSTYIAKPSGIDKQCYHVGMVARNSFTGTTTATIKYNNSNVKSIVVVGVNTNVTSANTLSSYYSGSYYNRNVFFTFTSELGTNYTIN